MILAVNRFWNQNAIITCDGGNMTQQKHQAFNAAGNQSSKNINQSVLLLLFVNLDNTHTHKQTHRPSIMR